MENLDVIKFIEDTLQEAVRRRKGKLLKAFEKLKEDMDKVKFVEELMEKYGKFDEFLSRLPPKINKSDQRSLDLQQHASRLFRDNKPLLSLRVFNESFCYAQPNSWTLASGIASRSVILLALQRYEDCLSSIKLAKSLHTFPAARLAELRDRERLCRQKLDLDWLEEPSTEFTDKPLCYGPHFTVPYISEGLTLKTTKEKGRHIVTKRTFMPGGIISKEKPFCSVLDKEMKYIRCNNCLEECYYTAIPCPNCVSAIFCSRKCYLEARNIFHKYECPIIDILYEKFHKLHTISVRLLLVAMNLFKSTDEWSKFTKYERNKNKNSFTVRYATKTHKKEQLKVIHGLCINAEKRTEYNLFYQAALTCLLRTLLLDKTPMKDIIRKQAHINFLTDRLMHYVQISYGNTNDIILTRLRNVPNDEVRIGASISTFRSLCSHSCAPNVRSIYRKGKDCLFVVRPLRVGRQIKICYDYDFDTKDKEFRQNYLRTRFHFTCKCEACENDYPTITESKRRHFVQTLM